MVGPTGKASAVTVLSTIENRRGYWFVRAFLRIWASSRFLFVTNFGRNLTRIGIIHQLQWSVLSRLPYLGDGQPSEPQDGPLLFFIANHLGDVPHYIDDFYDLSQGGIGLLYQKTPRWPEDLSGAQFRDVVLNHNNGPQGFWADRAYQVASPADIYNALVLRDELAEFAENLREQGEVRTPTPEEEEWLISRCQGFAYPLSSQ